MEFFENLPASINYWIECGFEILIWNFTVTSFMDDPLFEFGQTEILVTFLLISFTSKFHIG
jgi:hypothetical protein